ncbi:hypothetical protein M0R45_035609 [Rubus argutus]
MEDGGDSSRSSRWLGLGKPEELGSVLDRRPQWVLVKIATTSLHGLGVAWAGRWRFGTWASMTVLTAWVLD